MPNGRTCAQQLEQVGGDAVRHDFFGLACSRDVHLTCVAVYAESFDHTALRLPIR